jgi:hypothetical protein
MPGEGAGPQRSRSGKIGAVHSHRLARLSRATKIGRSKEAVTAIAAVGFAGGSNRRGRPAAGKPCRLAQHRGRARSRRLASTLVLSEQCSRVSPNSSDAPGWTSRYGPPGILLWRDWEAGPPNGFIIDGPELNALIFGQTAQHLTLGIPLRCLGSGDPESFGLWVRAGRVSYFGEPFERDSPIVSHREADDDYSRVRALWRSARS